MIDSNANGSPIAAMIGQMMQTASSQNPGVPDAIQHVLDRYAQGKASSAEVRRILQPMGYSMDLRRGGNPRELMGPHGAPLRFDF